MIAETTPEALSLASVRNLDEWLDGLAQRFPRFVSFKTAVHDELLAFAAGQVMLLDVGVDPALAQAEAAALAAHVHQALDGAESASTGTIETRVPADNPDATIQLRLRGFPLPALNPMIAGVPRAAMLLVVLAGESHLDDTLLDLLAPHCLDRPLVAVLDFGVRDPAVLAEFLVKAGAWSVAHIPADTPDVLSLLVTGQLAPVPNLLRSAGTVLTVASTILAARQALDAERAELAARAALLAHEGTRSTGKRQALKEVASALQEGRVKCHEALKSALDRTFAEETGTLVREIEAAIQELHALDAKKRVQHTQFSIEPAFIEQIVQLTRQRVTSLVHDPSTMENAYREVAARIVRLHEALDVPPPSGEWQEIDTRAVESEIRRAFPTERDLRLPPVPSADTMKDVVFPVLSATGSVLGGIMVGSSQFAALRVPFFIVTIASVAYGWHRWKVREREQREDAIERARDQLRGLITPRSRMGMHSGGLPQLRLTLESLLIEHLKAQFDQLATASAPLDARRQDDAKELAEQRERLQRTIADRLKRLEANARALDVQERSARQQLGTLKQHLGSKVRLVRRPAT